MGSGDAVVCVEEFFISSSCIFTQLNKKIEAQNLNEQTGKSQSLKEPKEQIHCTFAEQESK